MLVTLAPGSEASDPIPFPVFMANREPKVTSFSPSVGGHGGQCCQPKGSRKPESCALEEASLGASDQLTLPHGQFVTELSHEASGILATSCATRGPYPGWDHPFLEAEGKRRRNGLALCLSEKLGSASPTLAAGVRGTRNCSSNLLLGFPAARQPQRGNAYGCQCRGNGSGQALTLLPQGLAHLRGSYGERQRMRGRSSCFSQIPLYSFSPQLFMGHSLNCV